MRMKIVSTAQIVTILHKTGLNIDESEVLVLPVHSRETRLVSFQTRLISFLSRRVSRETRRVSRDGGNLLLTGTVWLVASTCTNVSTNTSKPGYRMLHNFLSNIWSLVDQSSRNTRQWYHLNWVDNLLSKKTYNCMVKLQTTGRSSLV